MMKLRQIVFGVLVVSVLPLQAQLPYQNPSLSAYERAKDLCSRLTLEEKSLIMCNNSPSIPRLGVPQFEWWSETLHGVARNGTATVFPQSIGMAASWDDNLLLKIFHACMKEARAKNNIARHNGEIKLYQGLSFWTPNINIFRDPRWGRGQETYGEDPYLTSRMGVAVVKGLQGEPKTGKYYPLLACAKHFAVHSGPEWSRHSFNIENLPERDLWETYLPAFKALVQQGNVREIMCAYQRFDGQPCCGNNRLLQQILRDEWGFDGLVVSDCGAISDFWEKGRHGVDADAASASAHAVRSGTDVECGSNYKSLPEAVKAGKIAESTIDTSVIRLLQARFELGDFDGEELVPWKRIGPEVIASKEHRSLALDMAHESMTLLQNKNNILPLSKDANIAVMGPNANDSVMLWGNYNGFPLSTVTLLQGLQAKAANVTYIPGAGYTRNEPTSAASVAQKAKDADVVIFCGGLSPRLEGEEMKVSEPGFKGGDRTTIELPQSQRDVMKELHRLGKRIIFINLSGSAIAMEPETRHADAILQAWYPGEAAGTAVADVIFGDYNPSGHLPITFYASDKDLPDFENYNMQGRTYRYFDGQALFPFGYGLSYTTFNVEKPRYKQGKLFVTVANIGKRDGDEVIQMYVRNPRDTNGPKKTLRDFRRIHLKAGESKNIEFDLTHNSFELWDSDTNTMRFVPGDYQIMVGTSSADNDLKSIVANIN